MKYVLTRVAHWNTRRHNVIGPADTAGVRPIIISYLDECGSSMQPCHKIPAVCLRYGKLIPKWHDVV